MIAVSNFIGNVAAPASVLLTPVVILIVSYVLIRAEMKLSYRVLLIVVAIVLNDFFIKLFAGGTHDMAGAGFINLFLLFGLVIATGLIFIELKFAQKNDFKNAFLSSLLIPAVGSLYIYYFGFFGLIYSKPISDTAAISRQSGAFLGHLQFSEDIVAYSSDSVMLIGGWSEQERKINHKGLFQKEGYSDNILYVVKAHHNFKSHSSSLYFQVNSKDVNGSSPVDSTIYFSLPKSDTLVYLTFFKIRGPIAGDSILQQVKINIK